MINPKWRKPTPTSFRPSQQARPSHCRSCQEGRTPGGRAGRRWFRWWKGVWSSRRNLNSTWGKSSIVDLVSEDEGDIIVETPWELIEDDELVPVAPPNIDEFVAEMEELASSDGAKGDTKSHGPRPDVVQVDVSGNKGSGDKSPRPSGGE